MREVCRFDHVFEAAREIAFKAGCIRRCPVHQGNAIADPTSEAELIAYRMGKNLWRTGKVNSTCSEFMNIIRAIIHETGVRCEYCDEGRE